MPALKFAMTNDRLIEIIREVYRDHEARGLPRPSCEQLFAAAGGLPGRQLSRMTKLAWSLRRAGELPDLPRGDNVEPRPPADRAAVAAAIAAASRAACRPAPARSRARAAADDGPADPWADLVREHDARIARIRRWARAHEEVPCRCD